MLNVTTDNVLSPIYESDQIIRKTRSMESSHPTLLERSSQLEALRELAHDASVGKGRLLFLGGEAGIGKSSLVRHFAAGTPPSTRVLTGVCDPLSAPRPLGPIHDVADSLGDVARLLTADAPRSTLFKAILTALGNDKAPSILIIEDVHWADEATLDLLRYLGRRLTSTPSLLIATYRNDEVGGIHPLRVVMGDLATSPNVRRMHLLPLSVVAVQRLAVVHAEDSSQVDPVVLHRQTRGNPFFIVETLKTGGGKLPETVRDAILARTSRLSADARQMLECVAVFSSRVDVETLCSITKMEQGRVASAVQESLSAGLLTAEGKTIEFRHELGRQAILQTMSPTERIALHASALAMLGELPLQQRDLGRLVHHAEEAGDSSSILLYAPVAARQAASLGAHRDAAHFYARALRVADRVAPGERCDLLEAAAYEQYLTGEVETAIQTWQMAISERRRLGDKRQVGVIFRHLARAFWVVGRRPEADESARNAIAILEELPVGPELAMAYSAMSQLCMLDEDVQNAILWGRRGISLAERLGDAETLTHALNNVGFSRLIAGDEGGREDLERSLRLAIDEDFVEHTARAYMNLIAADIRHFQFAIAGQHLTNGLEFATEHELDVYQVSMISFQIIAQLYQGKWDEAESLAKSVLNRSKETTSTTARPNALVVLARINARRGTGPTTELLDEALAVAESTAEFGRIGAALVARAESAWLAGDNERANAAAARGFALAQRNGEPWLQGELAVWLRRVGGSAALPSPLPELPEPFFHHLTGDWLSAANAWALRGCPYESGLALLEGNDEASLRKALAIFTQLGARSTAAITEKKLRVIGVRDIPRGPRATTKANEAGLTERELEVLELIALGLQDREISARLFISLSTAEKHVAAIRTKLGVRSRFDAVEEGFRRGLLHVRKTDVSSPPPK